LSDDTKRWRTIHIGPLELSWTLGTGKLLVILVVTNVLSWVLLYMLVKQ
jgi:hypothetical protein